jgi:hypothetical protein
MMNTTVISRRAVYLFLYRRRVDSPKIYYGREDLVHLAERTQLEAALTFGLEMGHVERYRKQYFRLTAPGMIFTEQQGWAAMEEDA